MSERQLRSGEVDPVNLYLNDIGKFPLLTREQEVFHGRIIATGHQVLVDASDAVGVVPPKHGLIPLPHAEKFLNEASCLSDEDRTVLVDAYRSHDTMVNSNLRLVVSLAKRYDQSGGLKLLDLVSEGNIGLISAVNKYNPEKGFRFSTYAAWWIRQSISRAVEKKQPMIHLPETHVRKIKQLGDATTALVQILHREPTEIELATELDTDISDVTDRKVIAQLRNPDSLDEPLGPDDNSDLKGDIIADPSSSAFELHVANSMILDELLQQIPDHERQIVEMRRGVGQYKDHPMSLSEIGQHFGYSREWARLIEVRAMRKLKKAAMSSRIQSEADDEEK